MGPQVLHDEQRRVGVGLLGKRPLASALDPGRRAGGVHWPQGVVILDDAPVAGAESVIEDRVGAGRSDHRRVPDFGLRMSSRALPTRVKASTTSTTQAAGGAMYHQARRPGAPADSAALRI